ALPRAAARPVRRGDRRGPGPRRAGRPDRRRGGLRPVLGGQAVGGSARRQEQRGGARRGHARRAASGDARRLAAARAGARARLLPAGPAALRHATWRAARRPGRRLDRRTAAPARLTRPHDARAGGAPTAPGRSRPARAAALRAPRLALYADDRPPRAALAALARAQ